MFKSPNFSVKHHHKSTQKKKFGPNPQTEQGLRTAGKKIRRTAKRTGANLRRLSPQLHQTPEDEESKKRGGGYDE